jgi:hypothetical protein
LSPSYSLASSKGSVVRPFSKPNSYASTISLSPAYDDDSVDSSSLSLVESSDVVSLSLSVVFSVSSVVSSSTTSSVVVSVDVVVLVVLVDQIEDDHPPVLSVQSYPYPYPDTYPYAEHE